MNRPVHFEIPADDLVRAKKFYEEVFGWKFKKWGENSGNMEYWLIETGPKEEMGINGGLMKRVKPVSGEGAAGYFCTMDIKDLEEIVEKVVFINRSSKVVKGGRRFKFSALVVVGDKKGKVGIALGKDRSGFGLLCF